MSDWPTRTLSLPTRGGGGSISVGSTLLQGGMFASAPASTAWPSANLAIFFPITVPAPVTVYKLHAGAGATAGSNNFDVGIYDRFGNRLVSSGAQVKGNSVEHILDVTDTVIGPGLYYLAMSADATGNYVMYSPGDLQKTRLMGVLQMATAYTLPATATFASASNIPIPAITAVFRSY